MAGGKCLGIFVLIIVSNFNVQNGVSALPAPPDTGNAGPAKTMSDEVGDTIVNVGADAGEVIEDALSNVGHALSQTASDSKILGSAVGSQIKDGLSKAWRSLKKAGSGVLKVARDAWGTGKSALGVLAHLAMGAVKSVGTGLRGGAGELVLVAGRALGVTGNTAGEALGAVGDTAKDLGGLAVDGLKHAQDGLVNNTKEWLENKKRACKWYKIGVVHNCIYYYGYKAFENPAKFFVEVPFDLIKDLIKVPIKLAELPIKIPLKIAELPIKIPLTIAKYAVKLPPKLAKAAFTIGKDAAKGAKGGLEILGRIGERIFNRAKTSSAS